MTRPKAAQVADSKALKKAIGQRLAKARLASDLTQEEVGARIQAHKNLVYRYENGSLPSGTWKLLAMLTLFGASADQILGLSVEGTASAVDLGLLHLLVPEEVVSNVTHQTLWKDLTIVWKNRHRDPNLFDAIAKLLDHAAQTMGGEPPPAEQERETGTH